MRHGDAAVAETLGDDPDVVPGAQEPDRAAVAEGVRVDALLDPGLFRQPRQQVPDACLPLATSVAKRRLIVDLSQPTKPAISSRVHWSCASFSTWFPSMLALGRLIIFSEQCLCFWLTPNRQNPQNP